MRITGVIPCFNEALSLSYFYKEICQVMLEMQEVEFELIFVDDGSTDTTLEKMKELAKGDPRIRYLSFSRNFGKEAAIYGGMEHASGDLIVIMDADLQDPPALIKEMYLAITEEGYDSVATRRVSRKGEPPIRSIFARAFYKLMRKISDTEIVDGARDFRMMTRDFANTLLSMKEYNRFSKGLFGWVGFQTKWIEYENVQRVAGETKWSFWKLFRYSIEGIVAFSIKPLSIASLLGMLMCVGSAFAIIFIVVRQLLYGGSAFGWTSLVCILLFVSGIQLLCMGILGTYLARTYLEVKKRPIYVMKETNL